jgi:hypothetical protein
VASSGEVKAAGREALAKLDVLHGLLEELAEHNARYVALMSDMTDCISEMLAPVAVAPPPPEKKKPVAPRSCRGCGAVGHNRTRCPTLAKG